MRGQAGAEPTSTEAQAALSNDSLVALWEARHDALVYRCCLRRLMHLLIRRAGTPIPTAPAAASPTLAQLMKRAP